MTILRSTIATGLAVSLCLASLPQAGAQPIATKAQAGEAKTPDAKAGEAKAADAKPGDGKTARKTGSAFGNFGASKEPVRIDAGSLQVIDKEQKAIYAGDVVAIQGATTLRCSKLTVFYTQGKDAAGKDAAKDAKPKEGGAPAAGGSSIKKLDCEGPVSVVSATQTATGDHGVFEADREIVTLTGNVVLADCENVQRGDKLVYNTKTGIANVTNTGGRRVQGVFTPGSEDKAASTAKQTSCKDKK
ncbi:MAG: organic solvent tolerance protein OstA [Beijerinckiaceae bacterium]|nr:organic solvent tolerance protein OstA [Beijerinckiaceae bacterium]